MATNNEPADATPQLVSSGRQFAKPLWVVLLAFTGCHSGDDGDPLKLTAKPDGTGLTCVRFIGDSNRFVSSGRSGDFKSTEVRVWEVGNAIRDILLIAIKAECPSFLSGEWAFCLSTPKQGAALVFFDYYPLRGLLEVVIGGFSGRDTWYVARALSNNARNFWPPSFSKPDRQIGMFILQIDYWKDKRGDVGNEPPPPDGPAKVKVIPLATEALESRIK